MNNKAFTPEKVRELHNKLHSCCRDDELRVFLEWLEQNQPDPVVVGLSDEQVGDLALNMVWNGSHYDFLANFERVGGGE